MSNIISLQAQPSVSGLTAAQTDHRTMKHLLMTTSHSKPDVVVKMDAAMQTGANPFSNPLNLDYFSAL